MKPVAYLTNLTPLRGIAAILTVIYHLDLMLGGVLLRFGETVILGRLYLMVDFFFVLSGFIMLHVYGQHFSEQVTGTAFKKFTVARFARVYPLHFVMLMYTVVLFSVSGALGIPDVPVMQVENNWFSVLTNLLLLQSMNLHNWFSWVHASWSISTEWWMYMVFPFLVRPFMRLSEWGKGVVAVLCFVGYAGIMFFIIPLVTIPPEIPFVRINPAVMSLDVGYQFGFLRCFFGFVLGMMMYHGYQQSWGKSVLANGFTMLALTTGLLSCLHFEVPDVFTVIFFPLILLSAAYGSQRMNAFLGSNPLQSLGDWSFSIYLTHQPLMFTIGSIMAYQSLGKIQEGPPGPPPPPDVLTAWLTCLGVLALTLLISFLTYRLVEVPARRWINGKK